MSRPKKQPTEVEIRQQTTQEQLSLVVSADYLRTCRSAVSRARMERSMSRKATRILEGLADLMEMQEQAEQR